MDQATRPDDAEIVSFGKEPPLGVPQARSATFEAPRPSVARHPQRQVARPIAAALIAAGNAIEEQG